MKEWAAMLMLLELVKCIGYMLLNLIRCIGYTLKKLKEFFVPLP